MPRVALITLHGMGAAQHDYADVLFGTLRERMADVIDRIDLRVAGVLLRR